MFNNHTHNAQRFIAAALAALALSFTTHGAAMADDHPPARLSLNAVGEVAANPDMATVRAGVIAEASTAREAMAQQRAAMTAAFDALKAAGVADDDLRTAGLSLSPVYSGAVRSSGDQSPRITGYRAANTVSATTRDVEAVGALLDALVDAGVNDIHGIEFGVTNEASLRDEARRAAVATLLQRAALYADAASFSLGPILDMGEHYAAHRETMMVARSVAMDAATPVAAGQLTISVTVNATWEIEQ